MKHYTYLIIGGGMTADAAVRGIREMDNTSSIGIIGEEFDPPYARPPLSKGLWKGASVDDIWLHTDALDVALHLGCKVVSIDTTQKVVIDEHDKAYGYDTLLLATGGTPRRLPFGGQSVTYYRTYADFKRIMSMADEGKSFAVIGGGFIGAEVAAALRMHGNAVSIFFPEDGICARVFPHDASTHLASYYREQGVEVFSNSSITDVVSEGQGCVVVTATGQRHNVDHVVAGIGIIPSTDLAKGAGLEVGNGIVVDEYLRTSNHDVFAAGDVASVYNTALSKNIRAEHEDSALRMGRAAGRAMAGERIPYSHLPAFYSDLFDIGYEAVGDVDSRHQTVAMWNQEYVEGVIYYVDQGRVVGVLLWNVWDKVDAARELIVSNQQHSEESLRSSHPLG